MKNYLQNSTKTTNLLKSSLFLLLFLCSFAVFADPQEQFDAANNAYQQGHYDKAIQDYETILKTGVFSKEIYFNLGNCYFKTKQLGLAVLNYERALKIAPNDEDTQFNLNIIREQLEDDLDVIGSFFLKDWWRALHQFLSSTTWSILTILTLWAGIAGILLWLFGTSRKLKKRGFISGFVLLALSIFLYFIANSQADYEENTHFAILLEKETPLKNGPDKESSEILPIHEGLKVELLDQIGDWYKVKLSNGEQGWLPKSAIARI